LVPLLKKKRISVSAAGIQRILRREGLQSREKRLAKLKKRSSKVRKTKSQPKKHATEITDEVGEHIVEISLQNPELGTKGLAPLLENMAV